MKLQLNVELQYYTEEKVKRYFESPYQMHLVWPNIHKRVLLAAIKSLEPKIVKIHRLKTQYGL